MGEMAWNALERQRSLKRRRNKTRENAVGFTQMEIISHFFGKPCA